MKAVIQEISGDPSSLVVGEVPVPSPIFREILIKVKFAALNRMDLLQTSQISPVLPPGASPILGVEVSGTIEALGPNCSSDFAIGDEVMALSSGGGYAEYCLVDERTVFRKFPQIDNGVAASIPEAFMTAFQLLFFVGKLQPGESVLLHAASSSIGQAAIQLCVLKGIHVFATARSFEKCQRCLELGAKEAFDLSEGKSFARRLVEVNGQPVNAILDPVGADYFSENIDALGVDGRLVLYGLLSGGAVSDPSLLSRLLAKRIFILPTTLRSRSIEYKDSLATALREDPDVFPGIASGRVRVLVDSIFPLEQVRDAHDMMRKNKNIGKILLQI